MHLTMKDRTRIETLQAVMDGRLEIADAMLVLKRSRRQIYRLLRRLRKEGLPGLIHHNRGRPSPRRLPDALRQRILNLVRSIYRDINDTHLCELLAQHEKIVLSRERLRQLLRTAGLKPKRRRKPPRYRSRRPRRQAFGELLQIDASPHHWLENRGPPFTLVGAKDDATGYVWARFVMAETTWAYLDLLREVFTSHGLPLALYSDRHTIFHSTRDPNLQEQLQGLAPLTQFGRAMHELGISIIKAYSAPAKGRIERQWGFSQDRLVVELRLDHAATLADANRTLTRWLRETVNARFLVPPTSSQAVFRKPPRKELLDCILCLKDTRRVAKDHTVSFEGLTLQIPPSKNFRSIAGKTVEVLQLRDGSVQLLYRNTLAATFSPAAISRLIQTKLLAPSNLKAVA